MSAPLVVDDLSRPFQLEQSALRGWIVRLGATIDRVLTRHDYPAPVSRLLGELFVLAATLAGGLKFSGTFSLQIRGRGPISLMVADCTNDGAMRGYAKFDRGQIAAAAAETVPALLGAGQLAVTVDQDQQSTAYQGLVELNGDSLTDCMLSYFRQSEQIRTGLRIAVDRIAAANGAHWRAGAIMVQSLPDPEQSGSLAQRAEEDWRRTMLLLGTVTPAELLDPDLAPDRLLLRLFHEEGVRVFAPLDLSFACRCSRGRVEAMLRRFPPGELAAMKQADGALIVTCEFCNERFSFEDADLAALRIRITH
jgi:molecular chaperone Hsp33